eukprot:gnl/MRDRNA2_/MRDRNA2_84492_c0_seq1.p1 gnl/MRDRNA2_/MRDRNA2_84492_c0~~gnl/MRDRNA2_/MRDRNA2_84492_c0_seq1.p1  ORF type:complete len:340 (+),score=29.86 gnl/MRDRNA2_/MRDRNA2_84492_c0_seq1:38-1057(+)
MIQVLGILSQVVDFGILASMLITAWETWAFVCAGDTLSSWRSPVLLRSLHLTISFLYVVEVFLCIGVLGVEGFFATNPYRSIIDMIMASICFVFEVVGWIDHTDWWTFGVHLTELLMIMRALRAERLMWRIRRLRVTMRTLFALIKTFRSVGAALFLLFYFYATLGVQIFGGRIRRDDPHLHHIAFTTSGTVGYFENNFNDFASGLVVLFELMVINNWFVIAEALAAVAPGSPAVGWLFCISFYACIHLVVLNVLVTSIVEGYDFAHTNASHKYTLSSQQTEQLDDPTLGLQKRFAQLLSRPMASSNTSSKEPDLRLSSIDRHLLHEEAILMRTDDAVT